MVNLSSDTPQRTREAAAWLAERGRRWWAAGSWCPRRSSEPRPRTCSTAGPAPSSPSTRRCCGTSAGPSTGGEDHGLAQLFYQARLTVFLTSLSAYLQAFALLAAEGADPARLVPFAKEVSGLAASYLDETVTQTRARTYPGDLSTATMMGATAEHILQACRDAGVDPPARGGQVAVRPRDRRGPRRRQLDQPVGGRREAVSPARCSCPARAPHSPAV
ncbi:hypothetical protein [Amycolatopsis methanolica]|uniref:imine reductase family protein n=1 Tax=Amycolatopsis methanolica TaxID=1814 RepID=UPI003F4D9795